MTSMQRIRDLCWELKTLKLLQVSFFCFMHCEKIWYLHIWQNKGQFQYIWDKPASSDDVSVRRYCENLDTCVQTD